MATEWLFLKNLLAIPALISSARQASMAAPVQGRWAALVFETQSQTQEAHADPPGVSRFCKREWHTIWTDGNATLRMEGLTARMGDHLYELSTRAVTHTKAHRCREGRLCSRYSEDYLQAKPLSGGKARPLWRSPDAGFLDFCRCEVLSDSADNHVQTEEKALLSIQSIVNNTISIDAATDEYDIAGHNQHGGRLWQTLKIQGTALRRQRINQKLLKLADAEFKRELDSNQVAQDYDPTYVDSKGFLMLPCRGGVAIEFQCASKFDPSDAASYKVRVEQPDGLDDEYARLCQAFIGQHETFIDWQKVDFYTIAPDQSAVVFARAGELFWKSTSTLDEIKLGSVETVGGWQWVDASRLTKKERARFYN